MALALESSSAVQRKVKGYCTGLSTGVPTPQGTLTTKTFDAFFQWWADNRGNADLQIVRYSGVNTDDSTGEDTGVDAAHRVYAIYGRKPATDEDVYTYFFDDATDDAGAGTDGRGQIVFIEASTEAFAFYPSGIPMVAGLVVKSYTDFDGVTDTTAGSAPNGFVIIGAP